MQPLIPSWFQEIKLLTATDLLSLLTYHKKCGDAANALKLDVSWITSHYRNLQACSWLSGRYSQLSCRCTKPSTPRYMLFRDFSYPEWWEDFMERMFTTLRDKPCKKTVQASAEETVRIVKAANCNVCAPQVAQGMRDFLGLFTRKVEEAISRVSSTFI